MNSFTYKIVRGLNCGIKFHEEKPDEGSKLISQEKFVKPRFCLLHSHHQLHHLFVVAGVSFETSSAALIDQIPPALAVFAQAVDDFIKVPTNQVSIKQQSSCWNSDVILLQEVLLSPRLSCMDGSSSSQETRWSLGDRFYKYYNQSFDYEAIRCDC